MLFCRDVRLSPFTGNLTEGVVEKATPDQVALMKKVMLQANEPGVSAEDRAFLKRMWDLTLRAERGSTLVAGAL